MKKVLLSLVMAVLLASSATVAMAAPGGVTDKDVLKDLAAARAATAKYHDVNVAIADGYVPDEHCVASPPIPGNQGVMGMHYVNFSLMDGTIELDKPEILLYVSTDDGPKLVGVEYFLPVGPPWIPGSSPPPEPTDPPPAPVIFGQVMGDDGELMEPHGPGQPWHYDLHVWLWHGNPNGIFEEFNPKVKCD
jgi:hypothetical protein